MTRELTEDRRDELLDALMRFISANGFAKIPVSAMASELGCSLSTLYRIAPNKDSLVALAIRHWGETALTRMESQLPDGATASERARAYYMAAVEVVRPHSHAFRLDAARFESSRLTYQAISDAFVDRFVELLDEGISAGDIRPVNTRLLAHVLRQIAAVLQDEGVLQSYGLTPDEGMLQVDTMIWSGVSIR